MSHLLWTKSETEKIEVLHSTKALCRKSQYSSGKILHLNKWSRAFNSPTAKIRTVVSRLPCGWLFSVDLSSLVFLLICSGVKEFQFGVFLTETCFIPSVPMLLIAISALLVFLSPAEFQ